MTRSLHSLLLPAPIVAALLLPLALGLPAPAQAQPAQAQPAQAQRFLEQRHTEVQRLLRQPSGERRDGRLSTILGELLDYDELSRRALSQHWEAQAPESRAAFVDLLRQLVERSYQANLENTLDYEVSYEGAEAIEGGVLVRTLARSATNRRAPAVSIEYRLHRERGQWRVFDVTTDGSSMVRSYRSQFNRIIGREGWEGLMRRMRARLEAGSEV